MARNRSKVNPKANSATAVVAYPEALAMAIPLSLLALLLTWSKPVKATLINFVFSKRSITSAGYGLLAIMTISASLDRS